MPRIILAALATLAFTLAACSSGGDGEGDGDTMPSSEGRSTATAAPASSDDEAKLRATVPAAFKAIFAGNALDAYGYFTSDFKEACSLTDFTGSIALISVFFGDIDEDDVEITVTDVRFENEKAFVTMEGTIQGEDLDLDSEDPLSEYWILEDGEWKFGTSAEGEDCDSDFSADSDDEATPASGPGSSRSEAAAIGDSLEVSDLRITLLEADTNAAGKLADLSEFEQTPVAGRRVVLARIRVEHIGDADTDETIQVYESDFEVTGSSNVIYDGFDGDSSCGFYEDTISGEMFPGGAIEGYLCIQVPEDESDLLLIADPGFGFDDNRRFFALE